MSIIIATIIWGLSGVFVKSIALPSTVVAAFRLGIPAFVLGGYLLYKRYPIIENFSRFLVIVSLLNAIRLFLFLKGLEYTTITLSVLMNYTSPVFVLLFSVLLLREKITLRLILVLLSIFVGIGILFLGHEFFATSGNLVGCLLMLGGSIIYAFSIVLLKKHSKGYGYLELLFYQNILGALIYLPFLLMAVPMIPGPTFGLSIVYGLTIGLIGFMFYFYGFNRMNVSVSSLLTYFEVVTGILFGVLLFHETITWRIVVGAIFIIAPLFFVHERKPIAIQKAGSLKIR